MAISLVCGSILHHFFVERRQYPEFRASRGFRESAFHKYLKEIAFGNFEHKLNAEALAFFSLSKRRLLKDAKRQGEECNFDVEMAELLNNRYKSFISPRIQKMVNKDPEKMSRFKSVLSERKRKDGYRWDTEWDAYLEDVARPDFSVVEHEEIGS
ncbi:MAG: hypothetical protein ACLFTR_05795 [Candidatus Woesearchaeota archaeon]